MDYNIDLSWATKMQIDAAHKFSSKSSSFTTNLM